MSLKGKTAVHHRRLARHRACDCAARRARRRQHRHRRQDRDAASQARRHDPHRRRRDREGRRPGAAARRRRARRGAVKAAIDKTAETFGGIDIVVNNASAVSRTPVAETDMKRYDLMQAINTRGTFMVSKYAIPHLEKAANPHILMNSPPLDMQEKWFARHHRLFDRQVRHEPGGARARRRAARQGHRGQRAVAARHHRDRRDQEPARRRPRDAHVAHARDHGGRGLRDLPQAGARASPAIS